MTLLYLQPKWLSEGDPDDDSFRQNPHRACLQHGDMFFSYDIFDIIEARRICATCPVFEQCACWGLAHYDSIEYGVWFGLTEQERKRIWNHKASFRDWRRYWTSAKYARMRTNAIHKRNRRNGTSKREQARAAIPPCPRGCPGRRNSPSRSGWDNERDTQRYRCLECGCRYTARGVA
jgi:hypothetical protein